jgi:hypothetical protein
VRDKVAAVELAAVNGHEIDLIGLVRPVFVPRWRAPRTSETDLDDRAVVGQRAPFALHSQDAVADLESQVVPGVFDDWAQDGDVERGRRGGDLGLGYGPFSVRRQHEHMFARRPDRKGSAH